MKVLKTKRALLKSALTRIYNFFETQSPLIDWQCRLERLDELWHDYMSLMSKMIEKCDGEETFVEEIEADAEEYESRILAARCKIRAHIAESTDQASGHNVSQAESNLSMSGILSTQTEILNNISRQVSSSNVNFLPKLKIKSFSGDLTEWKSFHDSFVSSIHNNASYTPCQKFQLLKSFLEGHAYEIIGQIPESNENYAESWKKLCNRYNKFGIIANTYVSKFFNITSVSSPNAFALRKMFDKADEVIRGLRALGSQAETRDLWLLHILISKLDTTTIQEWSKYTKSNMDFPTIEDFMQFLDTTCIALESTTPSQKSKQENRAVKSYQTIVETKNCIKCNGIHELFQCNDFLNSNTQSRREFVSKNRICFNCLKRGHISLNCRSKFTCKLCKRYHHTLLHDECAQIRNNTANVNFNAVRQINTLLPTALCHVRDCFGEQQQCRILLDSASEKTIISEKCVHRLGLRRTHAKVPINGLDNTSAGISQGCVSLHITSKINENEAFDIGALIMPTISSLLPSHSLEKEQYSSFLSLDLADPSFYTPSSIDILLGNDKFFEILKGKKIIGKGKLNAFQTTLGWIVGGDLTKSLDNQPVSIFFNNMDVDKALTHFWETEEILPPPQPTDDEKGTEDSFLQTYRRYSDGHMEKVPEGEVNKVSEECYYLPHHPVFKADSTTTRLRVVFDASAKHGRNPSLNETLFIGPSLLRDLFAILVRFRRHRYIISGDIEKMYRMIWVHANHHDFQRILWRSSENQPIEHYRLKTVTYGTACAPFLAVRVLEELAKQNQSKHPKAAAVIHNDFYMDDVITGAETKNELLDIHKELIYVLKTAGMNLRKWSSNCKDILFAIPEHLREMNPLTFEESRSLKLLGLKWNPKNDNFEFCISPSTTTVVTKQSLLSDAARIFDPLGFLTPCTVSIKIIFQKLWLTKLDWKEDIPHDIAVQWSSIRDSIHCLNDLNIPRRALYLNGRNELHGFCDASQNAYAAVVYCRSNFNDKVTVKLIAAKSRVAPLKEVSLPRLELCGALLLCRLMNNVLKALEMDSTNVTMWTDSSIVLHWLSSIPRRWSVYVANRTSEILSSYTRNQWKHIRSRDNPADPASRGVSPITFKSLNIWWNGPPWLVLEKDDWPKEINIQTPLKERLEERKKQYESININLTLTDNHVILGGLLKNISLWSRLVRSTAYCLRFIGLSARENYNKYLCSTELMVAKNYIVGVVQKDIFRAEILSIQKQRTLCKKSKLSSLSPFLDDSGILRVGGRISNSMASFSVKHPIILPSKHVITEMIVKYAHVTYFHAGVSHLIFVLRQEYWILGVRNLARRVVHKCHRCFLLSKTTQTQFMSDLPLERVQFQRPFSKVGCDYAGPFYIKVKIGRVPRKVKGYISLFVCFITKAIHLELVGDLTSDSFIGALDRFISRRGRPIEIWSDNATNFVGTKRKLDEMQEICINQYKDSKVADYFSQNGVCWRFIPPSSPHFGGLWESGVKSVKTHLKRVIGETSLSYEHFYTLLTRIEALLNSRPLCPSNDGEIDALTPGHFLIGQPYTVRAEPNVDITKNINPLKQWDKVKHMSQGFWRRWHSEYLTSLQQRQKWRNPRENIKINDIVILREPNIPQSHWKLAKVIKLHPSKDEKVRVVSIKTSTGEYVRPIVKLARLPCSEELPSISEGENE